VLRSLWVVGPITCGGACWVGLLVVVW
jgi:hypothetical protein